VTLVIKIQRYNSTSVSSVYSAMMFTQPTNHSARFANVGQQKTNMFDDCKQPTLLDNIKCWPTFWTWTHDGLLLANTVGQQMLANINVCHVSAALIIFN